MKTNAILLGACLSFLSPVAGHGAAVTEGKPVTLTLPLRKIACLAFTPDGKRLAVGGVFEVTNRPPESSEYTHGMVQILDVASKTELFALRHRDKARSPASVDAVESMGFTPDGLVLATLTRQGVMLWDATNGTQREVLFGYPLGQRSYPIDVALAFSPDGSRLAIKWGGSVELWDWRQRKTLWHLESFAKGNFDFSPDGQWLALGGMMLETKTGRPLGGVETGGVVDSLSFHPQGTCIAGAGNIRPTVWNVAAQSGTLTVKTRFELKSGWTSVKLVAFSPDGAMLATLGEETVGLWDAATGSGLGSLTHDTRRRPQDYGGVSLNAMAFSPDGQLLATTAGELGRVCLWNMRSALDPEVLSARATEAATAMLASLRTSERPINSHLAALSGPHARAAVPILLGALNDPEVKVRGAVIMALSSFPSESGTVVPALSNALLHESHVEVRAAIVGCLAQWGEVAKPAIPSLLQIVEKDENCQVRLLARRALQQMAPEALAKFDTELKSRPAPAESDTPAKAKNTYEGMPLDYWIEKFGQSNIPNEIYGRSARAGPLQAIRSFAPAMVVPALTNALASDKRYVRAGAAELLGTYGAEVGSAIPALCRALGDDSWETRRHVSDSLVIISKALGVVPADLRTVLEKGNPTALIFAARTMAQLEPTNEIAPRAIAEALRQIRADQRGRAPFDLYHEAASVLENYGPRAKVAVPELLLSLPVWSSGDFRAATNVTRVIAQIGVDSNMVPVLLEVLKSLPLQGMPGDSKSAALEDLVLREIGPPAIPILVDELKKTSPTNRLSFSAGRQRPEIKLLAGFGVQAVPFMVDLLQQPEERFRQYALSVIVQIGPAAKEAAPAVVALLASESASLRCGALAALAAIGPDAQAAIPAITPLLSDPNRLARRLATNAVMRIRGEGQPARP